jgi:hypothetical protein
MKAIKFIIVCLVLIIISPAFVLHEITTFIIKDAFVFVNWIYPTLVEDSKKGDAI